MCFVLNSISVSYVTLLCKIIFSRNKKQYVFNFERVFKARLLGLETEQAHEKERQKKKRRRGKKYEEKVNDEDAFLLYLLTSARNSAAAQYIQYI